MKKIEKFKCCLCGAECEGFGNNPFPLCNADDYESRCCDDCDDTLVLTARLMQIKFRLSDDYFENVANWIKVQNGVIRLFN